MNKRIKKKQLSRAAKIVLKDLRRIDLFRGIYDATDGSKYFMYGVEMVMECLAYKAGAEIGYSFADEFGRNMVECMEKAGVFNDDNA